MNGVTFYGECGHKVEVRPGQLVEAVSGYDEQGHLVCSDCAEPEPEPLPLVEPEPGPVMAFGPWRTNGEMIADVARVGYLRDEWVTLDMTYGLGKWWTHFRPAGLIGIDLDPSKAPDPDGVQDFRALPHEWRGKFDAVTFDPPYKLNGRPTKKVDAPYGVDEPATIGERHRLMAEGLDEAKRVLRPGGYLLVKCQDQVASGHVWWQTDLVTEWAGYRPNRCTKVDRFDIQSYRAQPAGRRQLHARRNHSTLLVFRKDKP